MYPERYEQLRAYRNWAKDRFKDVTASVDYSADTWTGNASFTDLKRRRLARPVFLKQSEGANHTSRVKAAGSLSTRPASTSPGRHGRHGNQIFLISTTDGKDDLYVTDMHSDMFLPWTRGVKRVRPPPIDRRAS